MRPARKVRDGRRERQNVRRNGVLRCPDERFCRNRVDPSMALAMRIGAACVAPGARFVYILRSEIDPSHHYVGRAANVDERLDWHNAGPTGYTLQHRPWRVVVSIEFPDESTAAALREVSEIRLGPRLREATLGPR